MAKTAAGISASRGIRALTLLLAGAVACSASHARLERMSDDELSAYCHEQFERMNASCNTSSDATVQSGCELGAATARTNFHRCSGHLDVRYGRSGPAQEAQRREREERIRRRLEQDAISDSALRALSLEALRRYCEGQRQEAETVRYGRQSDEQVIAHALARENHARCDREIARRESD